MRVASSARLCHTWTAVLARAAYHMFTSLERQGVGAIGGIIAGPCISIGGTIGFISGLREKAHVAAAVRTSDICI